MGTPMNRRRATRFRRRRPNTSTTDPGWEGRNNRVIPKEYLTVVQAFGYSQTHFAGAAAGEMGGQVWRASEPAYYGDKSAHEHWPTD